MKITKLVLPHMVGITQIQPAAPGWSPQRKDRTIFLPQEEDADFFPLQENRQFLFRGKSGVWFGGTDESSFLVQLHEQPLQKFHENGEEAFYRSLKPTLIVVAEQLSGIIARRQGDILAVPLGTWEEVRRQLILFSIAQSFFHGGALFSGAVIHQWHPSFEKAKCRKVFGTRHSFSGDCTSEFIGRSIDVINTSRSWFHPHMLAQGTFTAPDHEPLYLDYVHLVAQAQYLGDPKNAD